MKRYVIIVAGGVGSRFESTLPKQFSLLQGQPLIFRTIKQFASITNPPDIILVLNENHLDYWNEIVKEYRFNIQLNITFGGMTRFNSVQNGLKLVPKDALVAVHDAARPLINKKSITKTFKLAESKGTAVLAVYSRDSLRKLEGSSTKAVDRNEYLIVQTPQTFHSNLLKKAYLQPYRTHYTDDASVVEKMGEKIHIVLGSETNIKITFPEDLLFAESVLNQNNSKLEY